MIVFFFEFYSKDSGIKTIHQHFSFLVATLPIEYPEIPATSP